MKKLTVAVFISALALMLAGPAGALTIGTMTGAGTVTVDDVGHPITYAFSGAYNFDNTVLYPTPLGNLTLKQIMGEVNPTQYIFAANSLGNVPANDYDGYTQGSVPKGNFQYDLNTAGNGGAHSSTFYGSVLNFAFQGTTPTGTVTGTVKSFDGNIHWYYGYDTDLGNPALGIPAGMTSLATLGLSDTSNFIGTYTVTGHGDHSVNYSLSGTFTAVPLPSTLLLLGSGLLGLAGWRRMRKG